MTHELFLHQEIFLLALKDRKGTIASGARYDFAVGGAVMAELMLREKMTLDGDKNPKVLLRDRSALGDEVLDEWIGKIAERDKPRSIRDWVGRIARTKDLKHRIARGLCRKGILRADEDKVLLLFTRKIYPEVDPKPERELVRRLEHAIFDEGHEVDPRTAVVLALAHRAKILPVVFEKQRLKPRKDRIEEIARGERTAKATREAIEAMDAALVAAVVVPTVTSS